VGEVLITSYNCDYPLIRFATGDLSAVLPGPSPCGRTNVRIRGWLGRADQSTKVRAMFVTPTQVNEIVRRHAEILRARLVVSGEAGADQMTLKCEVHRDAPGLAEAIVVSIRDVTKLRGEVEFVGPGSLPNDGKVIEDLRKYG
jgi:phenylacetate-CoA ligase